MYFKANMTVRYLTVQSYQPDSYGYSCVMIEQAGVYDPDNTYGNYIIVSKRWDSSLEDYRDYINWFDQTNYWEIIPRTRDFIAEQMVCFACLDTHGFPAPIGIYDSDGNLVRYVLTEPLKFVRVDSIAPHTIRKGQYVDQDYVYTYIYVAATENEPTTLDKKTIILTPIITGGTPPYTYSYKTYDYFTENEIDSPDLNVTEVGGILTLRCSTTLSRRYFDITVIDAAGDSVTNTSVAIDFREMQLTVKSGLIAEVGKIPTQHACVQTNIDTSDTITKVYDGLVPAIKDSNSSTSYTGSNYQYYFQATTSGGYEKAIKPTTDPYILTITDNKLGVTKSISVPQTVTLWNQVISISPIGQASLNEAATSSGTAIGIPEGTPIGSFGSWSGGFLGPQYQTNYAYLPALPAISAGYPITKNTENDYLIVSPYPDGSERFELEMYNLCSAANAGRINYSDTGWLGCFRIMQSGRWIVQINPNYFSSYNNTRTINLRSYNGTETTAEGIGGTGYFGDTLTINNTSDYATSITLYIYQVTLTKRIN